MSARVFRSRRKVLVTRADFVILLCCLRASEYFLRRILVDNTENVLLDCFAPPCFLISFKCAVKTRLHGMMSVCPTVISRVPDMFLQECICHFWFGVHHSSFYERTDPLTTSQKWYGSQYIFNERPAFCELFCCLLFFFISLGAAVLCAICASGFTFVYFHGNIFHVCRVGLRSLCSSV